MSGRSGPHGRPNGQRLVTTSHLSARDVAERLYAATGRGDLATVAELLHPDVVLSVPGTNPASGTYRGMSGLRRFTATTGAIAASGAHTEVLEVLGGDRYAAVYGVSRAARPGGRVLRNETVHLVTVVMTPGVRRRMTVLSVVQSLAGTAIAGAEQSITAVGAPREVCVHIDVEEGSPVLRIDRVYSDGDGRLLELAVNHFNPHRYSYRFTMR